MEEGRKEKLCGSSDETERRDSTSHRGSPTIPTPRRIIDFATKISFEKIWEKKNKKREREKGISKGNRFDRSSSIGLHVCVHAEGKRV